MSTADLIRELEAGLLSAGDPDPFSDAGRGLVID